MFDAGDWVDTAPVVVNETVYVTSDDGTIYALGAGVRGSSTDSRANLGTLSHHGGWAGGG
mgnify:FL=1